MDTEKFQERVQDHDNREYEEDIQNTPYTPYVPTDEQIHAIEEDEEASESEAEFLMASLNAPIPSRGEISYYGTPKDGFGYVEGKKVTANQELFNPHGLTAAHKSLPFGTLVRVTNPSNKRSVVVRINDRGPYYGNREFDLATGAFKAIADPKKGTILANFQIVSLPKKRLRA